MSNVTSLELSKELYAISGWDDSPHTWFLMDENTSNRVMALDDLSPAYDLGYLIRKLPPQSYIATRANSGATASTGNYKAGQHPFPYTVYGDTPENAAAKLCIELFKQNILTREKE